ncbi:MAG: imidazolonepropionase [Bacteroidota bacterium]|jgi:imidazolonepropionase
MKLIVKNIGYLLNGLESSPKKFNGKEMGSLPVLQNAWLCAENGRFHSFGSMKEFEQKCALFDPSGSASIVDAQGAMVGPTWCDSHTHIVYAAPREREFVDRIHGLSYEEIAKRGGGILNSAAKMANSSEEDLYNDAMNRLGEMICMGTGAVEIKSGYGLSLDSEIKMLRVIRRIKENAIIPIKSTFLGAHAVPSIFKQNRSEYIRLIVDVMLPRIADEGLADYCDVFCDRGFFTVDETDSILAAGWKYGIRPKIHANELDNSGGIQVGVKHNALSVDHLEFTGDDEINCLLNSETMPTILPSTAFFLKLHYAPARKMIDSGLPVALATDFNPGSSPSGNMPFVLSLACIYMGMTPEESIAAATLNGAYAMDLSDKLGSITPGKDASFFITEKLTSPAFLPYSFGSRLIKQTYIQGKPFQI